MFWLFGREIDNINKLINDTFNLKYIYFCAVENKKNKNQAYFSLYIKKLQFTPVFF